MQVKEILQKILEELSGCLNQVPEQELILLEEAVRAADHVFVAGAGRALLMIRPLAMRLMHMGYHAYVVGETVTPAIAPGDLLIIASGSGTTGTMQVVAKKCKTVGAKLALITTMPESPIGRLADVTVTVPASTTKNQENTLRSGQPGASAFEQCVLLIGDALILDLISGSSLEEKNAVLMNRHANLE